MGFFSKRKEAKLQEKTYSTIFNIVKECIRDKEITREMLRKRIKNDIPDKIFTPDDNYTKKLIDKVIPLPGAGRVLLGTTMLCLRYNLFWAIAIKNTYVNATQPLMDELLNLKKQIEGEQIKQDIFIP